MNKLPIEKTVREFTISDIVPIAITFIVCTIALSYGAIVLSNVQSSIPVPNGPNASYAYNATTYGITSLTTFSSNLPLVATIVVASIIITILVSYLAVRVMG